MVLTNVKSLTVPAGAEGDRLREFDSVRLLEELPAGAGVMWLHGDETADRIVAGAIGAIVHAHGDDGPFEVEFVEPIAALATVRKDQIARR